MDCCRATQNLDSLWFYTNILTCRDGHVAASFADQRASQDRSTVEKANQHENVESTKCGGVSTAFKSNDSEMLEKRREKRKRRRKHRSVLHGMKVILGGLDCGFAANGFLGFQELCGYDDQMHAFDDDVAMKKHLRMWAYAVACTVKMKHFEKWQNYIV